MTTDSLKIINVKNLMSQTETLIRQQNRIRRLKGEDFNLFNICKIEHYEENTHSAFIAELLNPNGTHHKGNVFLKLFLERILKDNFKLNRTKDELNEYLNQFLKNKVSLHKEKSIGLIDDINGTGGRIDILLKSKNLYITIENKIYAKDQDKQLIRYYNFKSDNNLVIYLTLFGTFPEQKSIEVRNDDNEVLQSLNENDYQRLSYANDIKLWIEDCLRYAYNEPILRESLKQYHLLILKLTHQMNEETQKELHNSLRKNLSAASTIHFEYLNVVRLIKDDFRTAVFEHLKVVAVKYDLDINYGNDINHKFSQIWLRMKDINHHQLQYGIESFSGNSNDNGAGRMFYGILVTDGNQDVAEALHKKFPVDNDTNIWPVFEWIYTESENHLNLVSFNLLEQLTNKTFVQKQCQIISECFDTFISKTITDFRKINTEANQNN